MLANDLPILTTPGRGGDPLWQHQLELLLESTGEGIFGIDLGGNCSFINRAGARMLGWTPAEVLGRNMHELTHHSHTDGKPYPAEDCPIFNAFRQGLPCRIDTEVFWRRDHQAFAVEYSSYPIMDGCAVLGAVITFVDITERKRAADALQQAKDELEQRVSDRTRELSVALGRMRELAAYSETVREEERTRIAREVHDELGSLLVVLKMDVNWMDKRLGEQQQRTLSEAETMRQRLRGKCQNMSHLIERAVDNVGASSPTFAPASSTIRACGPRSSGRRMNSPSRPSCCWTGTCGERMTLSCPSPWPWPCSGFSRKRSATSGAMRVPALWTCESGPRGAC